MRCAVLALGWAAVVGGLLTPVPPARARCGAGRVAPQCRPGPAAVSAAAAEEVYDPESWREHRSSRRYVRAISEWSRGLAAGVTLATLAALAIAALDLSGFARLQTSAVPLAVSSPFLALLLISRVNSAYDRYWRSRTVWSGIKNRIRDLNRQATSLPSWSAGGERFAALAVAFAYALKGHLRELTFGKKVREAEDAELVASLTALVGSARAEAVLAESHRPQAVAKAMTEALGEAQLAPQLRARVDEGISELLDHGSRCEKLVRAKFGARLRAGLANKALGLWLLFYPAALLGAGFGFGQTVAGTTLTAAILLGLDRVAARLDEPFRALPLDDVCRGLRDEYERMVFDTKQQTSRKTASSAAAKAFPGTVDTLYQPA